MEAADIGVRAGAMHHSGEAARIWPEGPSGTASAVMLSTIEYLEGRARPCRRSRRLPERSLPTSLRVSEADRWTASEAVAREIDRRLHGSP